MRGFKQFLEESKVLDTAKSVDAKNRWLDKGHYDKYTDDPDEVNIKDLGMKMDHERERNTNDPIKGPLKYNNSALQKIPLEKVHYSQPSVNREKIRHFMKHYNPDHTDFHPEDGKLSKHEAPAVVKHEDGSYTSHDHHRLIASHLRGDTHAIARVYELGRNNKGQRIQKKAKSHFNLKDWDDKKD